MHRMRPWFALSLGLVMLAPLACTGQEEPPPVVEADEDPGEQDPEGTESHPEPEALKPIVLRLRLKEVRPNQGVLRVFLYDDQQAWEEMDPEGALEFVKMPAPEGRFAQVVFDGLKPGLYAILVHHDLDDDGELDTNVIGIPTDGLGCSNGARGGMFGGPPWEKARFEVPEEGRSFRFQIRVAYPAG